MVLYLWSADGSGSPAQCAPSGGVCPDGNPGLQNLAGRPPLRYDWPLPFVQGRTKAQSISPQEAVARAVRYGVDIQSSEQAQAPWYRYTDGYGITHEVWFEDARSIQAKLALIPEYGLYGVGYWNLMRPFPQNWRVLNALYRIRTV